MRGTSAAAGLDKDVEAIILGCTELPLLIRNDSVKMSVPIIDSIDVHISHALR